MKSEEFAAARTRKRALLPRNDKRLLLPRGLANLLALSVCLTDICKGTTFAMGVFSLAQFTAGLYKIFR